ncbi:hypothetical protein ABPG74_021236 [Tetrahymena malaccensis]
MQKNRNLESEQSFQVKLTGQNQRSYLDVALKVDSTVLSLDNEEQVSSQIHNSTLANKQQKSRVLNKSQNKHSICNQLSENQYYQNEKRNSLEQSLDCEQYNKTMNLNHENLINEQSILTKQSQSNNILLKADQKLDIKSIIEKIKPLFLNFINKYTLFGRQKHLADQSRKLIDDFSDKFNYQKQINNNSILFFIVKQTKKVLIIFEQLFIKILEKVPLFNPENKLRIFINGLIVLYNCFFLMTISFTLFFYADFGEYHNLFNYIAIVAWIFEMLLQMNTATYHDGDFITDRKAIFRIYLKEYFIFEIFPLIFEGKSSENAAINILLHLPLLLKLKGMSIILVKLEFLILQHLRKPYIIQIFKQLLSILLLIHLMACSYAFFGYFEKDYLKIPYNWIDQSKLQQISNDWWSTYFEAQLWAFYTMSNSYSSSIFSEYEYAFTSFWMLISSVLFAYNITTLGNILQDINSAQENYKKDLNLLNRYMKRKKIDIELQREMNSYFVRQYEQDSSTQFEAEKEALKKLNINMRNKLIAESNKHILKQFSFFNIFSQQTLQNIYQIMEEKIYSEGEVIQTFDQNTTDHFLYLILKGSGNAIQILSGIDLFNYFFIVQVIQTSSESSLTDSLQQFQKKTVNSGGLKNESKFLELKNSKVICNLKEGNMFGECEFFSKAVLPYFVQTCQKVFVIKISSNKFQEVVKYNKNDYQKFMELQSRIQFNNEINLINSMCLICKGKDHQFLNCHQSHLFVSNSFIIPKFNFSAFQERKFYNRLKKKFQRYIIEIVSKQFDSNIEEEDEEESQSSMSAAKKDEETSIFKLPSQQVASQNSCNYKLSKEEAKSELSSSTDSKLDNQYFDRMQEDILNQIKYVIENLNCKRRSIRQNISSKKQKKKNDSHKEVSMQSYDKFDQPLKNEKPQSNCLDDKNSNNNSQNNLGDLFPTQKLIYQIPQSQNQIQQNKSSNQIPSLQKIGRSIQFINQPQKQESIQELDKLKNLQETQIKNDQIQNSIAKANSLIPQKSNLQQIKQALIMYRNQESINQNNLIEEYLHTKQWNGSVTYWNFDKLHNFIYYYPQYNFKNVIKNPLKNREKWKTTILLKKK